jgi:hypothetical protein
MNDAAKLNALNSALRQKIAKNVSQKLCLELRILLEKAFQPIVNNIVLSMKFKASITVTTRRRKKTALLQMTFQ